MPNTIMAQRLDSTGTNNLTSLVTQCTATCIIPQSAIKVTPNKFPVSHPSPASVSCQHQKFHYFRISIIYSFVI